jgi:hypothetical protein
MTEEEQDTAGEGHRDSYWSGRLGVKPQSPPSYPPVDQARPTTASRRAPTAALGRVSEKPRHRLLVASLLIAVLVIGITAGIFLTDSTSTPTFTVQQAREAFKATWPGFSSGLASGNTQELDDFVTPEMLQAVIGWYNCGCGGESMSKPTTVHLSVPVEHQYPFTFLAEVSTPYAKGGPSVQEVVISKASDSQHWRVAYMVQYVGTSTYLGPSAIRSAPRVPFNTNVIGAQWASFFESMVNTGSPPPDLNIPVTRSVKQEVDHYASVALLIELQGDSQRMTFDATDHSTAFAYPGGDIICGAIHSTQLVTAPPGSSVVQPADRSSYGPLLLPGSYASVVKNGTHDYCVTVTTAGLENPVTFLGGVYQTVGQQG